MLFVEYFIYPFIMKIVLVSGWRDCCVCIALQYELVANLFEDAAQATTSPTRRAGGMDAVSVRPAKQLPKSSAQQKQARKTVGSQVCMANSSLLFCLYFNHFSHPEQFTIRTLNSAICQHLLALVDDLFVLQQYHHWLTATNLTYDLNV